MDSERQARQERKDEIQRELEDAEGQRRSLLAEADAVLTAINQARELLANHK